MASPSISLKADLLGLYRNLSITLQALANRTKQEAAPEKEDAYDDDSGNAYLYIVFVLMFYAFSIVVLMVKYIRREREGSKLEYYYNEFVKRDWYKDKNLYDNCGRRIHYRVDGTTVTKTKRKSSLLDFSDDEFSSSEPDEYSDYSSPDDVEGGGISNQKRRQKRQKRQNALLCVGAASIFAESAAIASVAINNGNGGSGSSSSEKTLAENSSSLECEPEVKDYASLGARPKRSSLKNWPAQRAARASPPPPTLREASVEDSDMPCGLGESFETEADEDEDVPLESLNCNKLMLCKVDENVRRVKSMPMRRRRNRPGLSPNRRSRRHSRSLKKVRIGDVEFA